MHGVHVDLAWVWLIFSGASSVGFLVLKDGHLNVDFLTPAFSDRLDEPRKPWMWVNACVNHELGFGEVVDSCEVPTSVIYLLFELRIIKNHVILCSEKWNIGHAGHEEVIGFEEVFQHLSPCVELILARQERGRVDDAVVRLGGHCLDHPAAEFWHQHNLALFGKVALVEFMDHFQPAIGHFEPFLLGITLVYLVLHFFAPLQILNGYVLTTVCVIYRDKLKQTMLLKFIHFFFILIEGEYATLYIEKAHEILLKNYNLKSKYQLKKE